MAERTLPGLGLTGYWDLGANTWKPGMDANLRLLSVIVRGWTKSRATAIPLAGEIGDVYLVPADAAEHPNEIAIWDGETGAEDWVYVTPQVGLRFFVQDEAKNVQWNGTEWALLAAGGGTTLPVIASGDAGKALVVKPTEDGYLYGSVAGGGGGTLLLPAAAYPTNEGGINSSTVSTSAFALKGNLYDCTENLTLHAVDVYIDNDTEGGNYQLHVLQVDNTTTVTAVIKISALTFSEASSGIVSFPLDNVELAAGSRYAIAVVATNSPTFATKVPFSGDGFDLPGLDFVSNLRTDTNNPSIGTTLESTGTSSAGDMVLRYAKTVDVVASVDQLAKVFVPGTHSASELVHQEVLTQAMTLKADAPASQAVARIAATSAATFSITKNDVALGSINFAAGATAGNFTVAADAQFASGDRLGIVAPGTQDATLADISVTLALARS